MSTVITCCSIRVSMWEVALPYMSATAYERTSEGDVESRFWDWFGAMACDCVAAMTQTSCYFEINVAINGRRRPVTAARTPAPPRQPTSYTYFLINATLLSLSGPFYIASSPLHRKVFYLRCKWNIIIWHSSLRDLRKSINILINILFIMWAIATVIDTRPPTIYDTIYASKPSCVGLEGLLGQQKLNLH